MTQPFILDENVVILAQKGENDRGETDLTCLVLLTNIVRICHTLVLDNALWRKYESQLSTLTPTQPQIGGRVLSTVANAFRTDGKVDFRSSDAPPFPEEETIPSGSQDDVPLVRLAVETRATLVTTDAPLKADLNSCGVAEAYSLQLLSPREALESV